MKIAHIVDSMEVGGAEMIVAQLCRWQRERGHEPSVFAHLRMGALGDQLRAEGFRVEVLGPAHLPTIMTRFLHTFRASKPDVVHCHNPAPTIYAALPAKLAGAKRIISTRHGTIDLENNRKQETKYAIASWFCNRVVGICEATCDKLRKSALVPKNRIERVYNGTTALPPPTSSLHDGGTRFLYVGRLAPIKDHGTLLCAFALVLQERSDVQLTIVGDGASRPGLEALATELQITEKVHFAGQQLNVSPYFSSADVFVMSSLSEGVPMSLLQAMSIEMPAVVTDAGGMAEVVRLSKCGIVVPISDPNTYSQAMLKLCTDVEQRRTLGRNGLASYQNHFTLDAMANSYLQLYSR